MVKTTVLVTSLLMIGAATLLQTLLGAQFLPGPFNMIVTVIAAIIVIRSRKPTVGLVVAAWLALGPIAMPYAADHLRNPEATGVFASTVLQLLANAVALISGIAAQLEYSQQQTPHA